jgi:hypothetical protein
MRGSTGGIDQPRDAANCSVKSVHNIFKSLVFMQGLDAVGIDMHVVEFEVTCIGHFSE